MVNQYSHLQFLRQVPNAMLAQYFESRGASLDVAFAELKETQAEPILEAFLALDADQQAEIEAEFSNIHALACEGGIVALLDESRFPADDPEFEAELQEIEGFHAKVMWAFLERSDYWRGATMFLHAD